MPTKNIVITEYKDFGIKFKGAGILKVPELLGGRKAFRACTSPLLTLVVQDTTASLTKTSFCHPLEVLLPQRNNLEDRYF